MPGFRYRFGSLGDPRDGFIWLLLRSCRPKTNNDLAYFLVTGSLTSFPSVSELQITESLPDELRSSMPTIEQIEAELGLSLIHI